MHDLIRLVISSLSSSAMLDLYKPIFGKAQNSDKELQVSRIMTVIAAIILIFVAFMFITVQQSVVEIALGIASITYGGLLGTFLLGLFFPKVDEKSAILGFSMGIATMLLIILIPKIIGISAIVHWTWYVAIGSTVTIISGVVYQRLRGNREITKD